MGPSSRRAVVVTVTAVLAGLTLAWAILGTSSTPSTPTERASRPRAVQVEAERVDRGRRDGRTVRVNGEPRRVARALDPRKIEGASLAPWPGAETPRGARTSIQDLRHSLRSGVQRLAGDLGLVGHRADAVERLLLEAEERLDALRAGVDDGTLDLTDMHERLVAERAAFSDAVLQELGREHAEAVYQRLGGR